LFHGHAIGDPLPYGFAQQSEHDSGIIDDNTFIPTAPTGTLTNVRQIFISAARWHIPLRHLPYSSDVREVAVDRQAVGKPILFAGFVIADVFET